MKAPIIIFAFNRPQALKNMLTSLLQNPEAVESELYVFVDGPRTNRGEKEKEKVNEVREIVRSIVGFSSVKYHFSENNQGLASSIISGVTQIINKHGKAIILEDDLILSTNFLSFLNQGLNYYEKHEKIFSISGESVYIKIKGDYPYDTYFAPRSGCWGWATWADRWNSVDWDLNDWNSVKRNKWKFNRWGGSDCYSMLKDWKNGKNSSWAIRFCYSQFIQNKLSVFPIKSKVSNKGFTQEGTHCKALTYNRFKMDLDCCSKSNFIFNPNIKCIPYLVNQRLKHVRLYMRIYAKIRNILNV